VSQALAAAAAVAAQDVPEPAMQHSTLHLARHQRRRGLYDRMHVRPATRRFVTLPSSCRVLRNPYVEGQVLPHNALDGAVNAIHARLHVICYQTTQATRERHLIPIAAHNGPPSPRSAEVRGPK